MRKNDLSNKKFGKITVIKEVPKPEHIKTNQGAYWLCKCDCGCELIVCGKKLTSKVKPQRSCSNCYRYLELEGKSFGKLTVIKRVDKPKHIKSKNNYTYWLCLCECGNETIVRGNTLTNNHSKSCGCLTIEASKERFINLIGERFGRLTVIKKSDLKTTSRGNKWICICDCGKEVITSQRSLKVGHILSCGCYMRENNRKLGRERMLINNPIKNLKGKLNPNYNHNLSDKEREVGRKYTDYYEWRKGVFEKYNYTCDICCTRGKVVNAHHLNSYDIHKESRTELKNGVCLCKTCHDKFHKKYGKGKNTLEQYIEFKKDNTEITIESNKSIVL